MKTKWKVGDTAYIDTCCGEDFEVLAVVKDLIVFDHFPVASTDASRCFKTREGLLNHQREHIRMQIADLKHQLELVK